jgi:serine/threonine protein kinase
MPEHPDSDPTAVPSTNPPADAGLTRSYQSPSGSEDLPTRERATQLTGGAGISGARAAEALPLNRAGRYDILREIGRGGMGVVLEADDPQLSRHLAIKVLLEEHQHDATLVRRFLDEAKICGQLQHPGIVPVHEIGRLPDHRPFFTMKLIQGQTLAALLQMRRDPASDCTRRSYSERRRK